MSIPAKHFDSLDFVKKSKALGVKDELAEYQARQFENVIDIASAVTHELATKTDIARLEIAMKSDSKQLEVVESTLKSEIKQVESALSAEIKQVESALRSEIKQVESTLGAEIKQVASTLVTVESTLRSEIKQTESTLEVKIEQYRYDTLKFVVWTGIGVVIFLGGLLVKGFHWLH